MPAVKRPNPKSRKLLPPSISTVLAEVDAMIRLTAVNASVDPEVAHSTRDTLYEFALHVIANGHPHASTIAKRALSIRRIKLRWSATA